jgi:putative transposase
MEIIKSIAYEQIDNFPNVSTQTIRNYLKLSKNYPKRLKSRKYRKRFEAKYVGEIIQGDVSIHNWIPGIDEKYNLILFIDDKSRYILYAKFVESDSLENHITALKEIFFNFGLPISIYYDNDSKYNYIRRNGMYFDLDKQLEKPLIPNALDELGINLINSKPYQPQGKGKVERKFLTFQNQLPHYMLLENAKNIDDANRILAKYVEKHNKSYSKAINSTPEEIFKNSDDAFKQIKKSDIEKIENSLTRRHKRVVSKVNEISFNNKIYQVPKFKNYSLAGFEIEVRENPNNWIKLFYNGNLLTTYNIGGKIYV